MEIHHHAQTPRRKWTHYFWEFLMLFLAVFCGFLAEYQLEHTIEHQREKQFMISLVEDIQKDVINMESEIRLSKIQYENLDSLTAMIYDGKSDQLHVTKMYELQRRYLFPVNLRLVNRTALQLTNSGGMRLIRNKRVADSIIDYWSATELLYELKENINAYREKVKDISYTLFNNNYYNHDESVSSDLALDPAKGIPELLTKNPAVLSEFANRISHMSDMLKFNYRKRRLGAHAENARRLIQLIKREYCL
jgi:hypothetical protein